MTIAVDTIHALDPAAVLAAGVKKVIRYLPTAHQAYGCTQGELDAYESNGIETDLIFEEGGNEFLGGYPAGMDNATRAMAARNSVGRGADRPLYFCMGDPNPNIIYGNEDKLIAYTQGLAVTIDCLGGGYGSLRAIRVARSVYAALVAWGVQTWGDKTTGELTWIGATDPWSLMQLPNAGYIDIGGVQCDQDAIGDAPGPSPSPSRKAVTSMYLIDLTDGPYPAGGNTVWMFTGARFVAIGDPNELGMYQAAGIPAVAWSVARLQAEIAALAGAPNAAANAALAEHAIRLARPGDKKAIEDIYVGAVNKAFGV